MRTPEEIMRAMEVLAVASSDVLNQSEQDETKLQSFAMGLMVLAWVRNDGGNLDRMFQKTIEQCNAVDAAKHRRHRHGH